MNRPRLVQRQRHCDDNANTQGYQAKKKPDLGFRRHHLEITSKKLSANKSKSEVSALKYDRDLTS
ncbi:hypothetical protein [Prosthecobacter algae]|uniref:hypothetical protein n=1 Tax=Prosthecobacter algae TaxID=1144682 RepID=UPI0031E71BEC